MITKINLNLYSFFDGQQTAPLTYTFSNVSNIVNVKERYVDFDKLVLVYDGTDHTLELYKDNVLVVSFWEDEMVALYKNSSLRVITFDCELQSDVDINFCLSSGIINEPKNYTFVVLYSLNDQRNKLSKTITIKGLMSGIVKSPIGIKQLTLDIENYDYKGTNFFNYVFIPDLNRYYYVSNIEFQSKQITRILLTEDVLMSWKNLIKLQSAFITRYENSTNDKKLIDERLPVSDTYEVSNYTPINSTLKNVTFNYNLYDDSEEINVRNIVINTYTTNLYSSLKLKPINPPTGSGLPIISSQRSRQMFRALIDLGSYGALTRANVEDDATASFISSMIWLPFNPSGIFPNTQSTNFIHCGSKVLDQADGGKWVNYGSETLPVHSTWIHDGECPYLVLADFTFNSTGGITPISNSDDITIYKPYSLWEIYIPFVGWVEVNINQVKDKRILVTYALDLQTGLSTAYIYNYTDQKVIYSTTCQIGIKLNFVTSNEIENTKQKQANDLNMILGTLSSLISVGVGAYSGNAVAVAGGVINMGKTIAQKVNSNNMLLERGQINFGSSNTALYSPLYVSVRRSYHSKITIDFTTYKKLQGLPYNKYDSVASLTGYVEIGDINFNSLNNNIYNTEIDEIVALLKNGVIF